MMVDDMYYKSSNDELVEVGDCVMVLNEPGETCGSSLRGFYTVVSVCGRCMTAGCQPISIGNLVDRSTYSHPDQMILVCKGGCGIVGDTSSDEVDDLGNKTGRTLSNDAAIEKRYKEVVARLSLIKQAIGRVVDEKGPLGFREGLVYLPAASLIGLHKSLLSVYEDAVFARRNLDIGIKGIEMDNKDANGTDA